MIRSLGLILLIISLNSFASQIWFCPNKQDFLNERSLDGSWEKSRRDTSVFKFYYQRILLDTDQQLRQKIDFLNKNNIKIAVELPPQSWVDKGQGFGIESYGPPGLVREVMVKLKRNGGELSYVSMDEPMFYSLRKYINKNEISPMVYNSIDFSNMMDNIARNMNVVYEYYPSAKIGDIEPMLTSTDDFEALLNKFSSYFFNKTKHRLKFIQFDMSWNSDWKGYISSIYPYLNNHNIGLGVIFNSSNQGYNSRQWVQSAKNNILNYKKFNLQEPEQIVIQTWNHSPKIQIGDSNPDSHSSIVVFAYNTFNK